MNRIAAPITAALLLVMLLLTNGCGVSDNMEKMNKNTERLADQAAQAQSQLDSTNKHMERMAIQIEQDQQYIKLLADSLSKLEKIGTAMFSLVSDQLFVNTPPTKSDDIDDVLKGTTK